jgi:hypothetical protein
MLLYAQPLSRILRLSAGDLTRDEASQTWLRLGNPPSPVPAPFDVLLHQLAATRHDHVPANHGSDWLFPGRHAGQPAEYHSIAAQLREHGLPLRTARISALRQLVLQVPAPSWPAPSASATPPPPASTSTLAPPGAGMSQANGQTVIPAKTTVINGASLLSTLLWQQRKQTQEETAMPSMNLDVVDAAELAELLQFLTGRIASDPARLAPSLLAFAGHPAYGLDTLRSDLDRFTFLLGGSDGEDLFGQP